MKTFLESLLAEKAPGPYPSFSILHVLKAFELIASTKEVGRGKLSGELKIGEGATRTLIERLRAADLISASRKGCSLTVKGKKVFNEFQSVFPQKTNLGKNDLISADFNVAVQVRDGAKKVVSGIEQRDAAIKVGGRGAITMIFRKGKLFIPTVSRDVAQDYPKISHQITECLRLKEGDVVVIGSGDNWSQAEYGAWAAAWTLIENNGIDS